LPVVGTVFIASLFTVLRYISLHFNPVTWVIFQLFLCVLCVLQGHLTVII